MNNLFNSVINSQGVTIQSFLICIVAALATGLVLALAYTIKNDYTKSFVVTIALLPSIVCAVIMMVNGNVGAGVAVAGTFSLVRFRSAQGTAKEITAIFLAMAAGLAFGMGYIGFGVAFAAILGIANILLNVSAFGVEKVDDSKKTLKITIPEELDYTNVFDSIFAEYTEYAKITQVKTTNMGSMFKLTYDVKLKDVSQEKKFIDKLRVKNGNLEVALSRIVKMENEL